MKLKCPICAEIARNKEKNRQSRKAERDALRTKLLAVTVEVDRLGTELMFLEDERDALLLRLGPASDIVILGEGPKDGESNPRK